MLPSKALLTEISEKQFAEAVVELAQALGWTVFRTWASIHSPAGEPDLRMVHPIQKRVVWAELKKEGKHPTAKQQEAIETLRDAGAEAYVWHPSSWELLEQVLNGKRPGGAG